MQKGNLLIVDDEVILVKGIKANLEDQADRIFTAFDGIEALKVIDAETIHCVICDINMPRMNGIDFLKALREKNNKVPFIFFTAHGNHELMKEAAKFGAFDFLDKPYFNGIEDVVARGLNLGLNKESPPGTEEEVMDEYQKMLLDLAK